MIRIAVRVITLNVYSVNDTKMQDFILDKTTSTYFSNLVWYIGNYGTTINDMLLHPGEGESSRINYHLAEHMDFFYYVNDIIELDVPKVNKMLISTLLNKLLRPMYLDSLLPTNSQGAPTNKSSATTKLMPIVALSLMLHALYVVKHAPLVSALASTLFSGPLNSSNHQSSQQNAVRHSQSPLVPGAQSGSPESSRPSSPVTSKFRSFGLLGTSPAAFDSHLPGMNTPTSHVKAIPQRSATPPTVNPPSSSPTNPYKSIIYEYLGHVHNDRLVLPSLMLIYLAGRNTGIMSDVLLGTDIYPQRLLKSRQLMGNLMSSAQPNKSSPVAMSWDDSTLNMQSAGASPWTASSPRPVCTSSISGSLFGASVSATGGRMRTKTDSPLFHVDEDNEESRETEELLASEKSEPTPPQASPSSSTMALPSRGTPSSLPSTPIMDTNRNSRYRPAETESTSRAKPIFSRRKGRKGLALLGPILPAGSQESTRRESEDREMIQELKPVFTSKHDRESIALYPSGDEDENENDSDATSPNGLDPPPLPPRQSHDETSSMQESFCTQVGPTIQHREDIVDRLVDIICGQPESGAHRFRIMTIQVAVEVLLDLVYTKSSTGTASSVKDGGYSNSVAQLAAELQLGEARLQRICVAETQFRERVQKGIRHLERQKRVFGQDDMTRQPLGILTGRVERSLTESKLGVDKQIVNIITEATVMYGPDSDPDKEPDLDPDQELMTLFGLDPEYTTIKHEKTSEDDKPPSVQQVQLPATTGSVRLTDANRKRSKSIVRNMFMARMQGLVDPDEDSSSQQPPQNTRPPPKPVQAQKKLTKMQRLEAMVVRYIKWLHLLTQCRQLVCRKPIFPPNYVPSTTCDVETFGAPGACSDSPTILISESAAATETSTIAPMPIRLCARPPSELMDVIASLGPGLAKSIATTATTTTAVLEDTEPTPAVSNLTLEGPLSTASMVSCPSTEMDSAMESTLSSPTSSVSSSFSSTLPPFSPTSSIGAISATISQPASGSASGRIIGSRPLLSATAALEAAAAHASSYGNGPVPGPTHPFINEMLTNLDPLSASVTEAIRKGSNRIKRRVVDPITANPLFKSPLSPTLSPAKDTGASGVVGAKRGIYRPSGVSSSAASSVASLHRPGLQRSFSSSSTSTTHSVMGITALGAAATSIVAATSGVPTAEKRLPRRARSATEPPPSMSLLCDDLSLLNDDGTTSLLNEKIRESEDENYTSILDPEHPALESDQQVVRILQTLGLLSSTHASSSSVMGRD